MEKKHSLIDTLFWLKTMLEQHASIIDEYLHIEKNENLKRTVQIKKVTYDDRGCLTIEETDYFRNETIYSSVVKVSDIHSLDMVFIKDTDIVKREVGIYNLVLKTYLEVNLFSCNIYNENFAVKNEHYFSNELWLPMPQDEGIRTRIFEAFKYLAENFGDNRIEPF